MSTISFKAQDELQSTLSFLAQKKGINLSALIKLLLTEALSQELSKITTNGMTIAEEFAILQSDMDDEVSAPVSSVSQLRKSLGA